MNSVTLHPRLQALLAGDGGATGSEAEPWLDRAAPARRDLMLALLAESHVSLSSVTDPAEACRVHVADSLFGPGLPRSQAAKSCADLGAGAGFPGILLAAFLPECEFVLIDSVGRKVDFMNEAISALGLENARAIKARSEDFAKGEGREAFDLVTARAVARLPPRPNSPHPASRWRAPSSFGRASRNPTPNRSSPPTGDRLAMEIEGVREVMPHEGSRDRRLYLLVKAGLNPGRPPQAPGMARKTVGRRLTSDRSLPANK